LKEDAWRDFFEFVKDETKGGYEAVGSFTYFDSNHCLVPNAVVTETALPAVADALMAGEIEVVAGAHSAVDSYLPCF
jgi:hypothetical protein